jgi:hypothetical protein
MCILHLFFSPRTDAGVPRQEDKGNYNFIFPETGHQNS